MPLIMATYVCDAAQAAHPLRSDENYIITYPCLQSYCLCSMSHMLTHTQLNTGKCNIRQTLSKQSSAYPNTCRSEENSKYSQLYKIINYQLVYCSKCTNWIKMTYWSDRSACAARAALQTGCVANVVATKFVVFFFLFLSFFLSSSSFSALLLFSQKGLS